MDIDLDRFASIKIGLGAVTVAGIAGLALDMHFINELMLGGIYACALYTAIKGAMRAHRAAPYPGERLRDRLVRAAWAAVKAFREEDSP